MITASSNLATLLDHNIYLLPIVIRLGIHVGTDDHDIASACKAASLDTPFVLSILNTYHSHDYFPDIQEIDTCLLIDFLKKTHTYHHRVILPRIGQYFDRFLQTPTATPALHRLKEYFLEYQRNIELHMQFEEDHLFPIFESGTRRENISPPEFMNLSRQLLKEHGQVEDTLSDLKTIIIKYIPKDIDAPLMMELLFEINRFQREQWDHSRFEDKILLPKLQQMTQTPFPSSP